MKSVDYKSIFESLPGCNILVAANYPNFTIVSVSDCYAEATFTDKEEIVGQNFFDVFTEI